MGRECGWPIHTSSFLLSCTQLLRFLFYDLEPSAVFQLRPPIVAMTSNLTRSRLRTEDGLRRLRRFLGWQSPGFDGWMRCGTFPLVNLQPREFVFFSCYVVAGLVPPVSSLSSRYWSSMGSSCSTCHRTHSF
jgi:hypothetical protein